MFDDILLFVNLVNAGNFAQVAKQLKIAPSTITRRMLALETTLAVQLLKRESRSVALTAKGQILYENFKNCEVSLANLLNPVYLESELVTGSLNILLPPDFSNYAISPYLGEFALDNPQLQLALHYHYREINMVRDNYDIAILSYMPKQISQKIKLIHSSTIIAVCSKYYLKRFGSVDSIESLLNHHIIGRLSEDSSSLKNIQLYHKLTDEIIKIPNANNQCHVFMNNFQHVKEVVKQGTAIAGLPLDSISEEFS